MSLHEPYIIITGAAGFIGSGIIRHLNDQGVSQLILVDDLGKDDKWKNLVQKQFRDIISPRNIFEWLEQQNPDNIRAFIHLGACSSTVERDADYLLDNNYRFSVKLVEYALRHKKRFIYASSAATYGDGSKGFSDHLMDELEPLNMYGFSKHLFDLWLRDRGYLDRVVGLKYFNVFGPNEAHKARMASAVFKFYPQIRDTGKVQLFKSSEPDLFEDGGQKRDFIYVKDAARMTCAFLENEEGGIFNIGTGVPNTWNDLARGVYKALGMKEDISYIPMPEDLVGKYQNFTCADMGKTKSVLGVSADCISLEDSIQDYVCEHLVGEKLW